MTPRRRGARSIRGALGTYLWVSVGLVVVLALVLHYGPDGEPARAQVLLPADSAFQGVTLDAGDGGAGWALAPGESVELPPGRWRLTIFDPDGGSERVELTLDAGQRVVVGG